MIFFPQVPYCCVIFTLLLHPGPESWLPCRSRPSRVVIAESRPSASRALINSGDEPLNLRELLKRRIVGGAEYWHSCSCRISQQWHLFDSSFPEARARLLVVAASTLARRRRQRDKREHTAFKHQTQAIQLSAESMSLSSASPRPQRPSPLRPTMSWCLAAHLPTI